MYGNCKQSEKRFYPATLKKLQGRGTNPRPILLLLNTINMQKTFKKGGPKVVITKNKLVTIYTEKESINFYFGNPDYIEAEKSWMGRFLWAEYCDSMQEEIKEYVFSNI